MDEGEGFSEADKEVIEVSAGWAVYYEGTCAQIIASKLWLPVVTRYLMGMKYLRSQGSVRSQRVRPLQTFNPRSVYIHSLTAGASPLISAFSRGGGA